MPETGPEPARAWSAYQPLELPRSPIPALRHGRETSSTALPNMRAATRRCQEDEDRDADAARDRNGDAARNGTATQLVSDLRLDNRLAPLLHSRPA